MIRRRSRSSRRIVPTRRSAIAFADDALVMCRSQGQAVAALARLTALLAELGLKPKPAKTRIVKLEVGGEGSAGSCSA
jgi:hypothetical protein